MHFFIQKILIITVKCGAFLSAAVILQQSFFFFIFVISVKTFGSKVYKSTLRRKSATNHGAA
jgi:hypothetical protein